MGRPVAKIRVDERMFTELIKGNQVSVESPIMRLSEETTKIDIILADIGYARMLDILENSLDDLSKTDASKNWENRKISSDFKEKELSEISDEDAIEVGKIIGWELTETVPLFVVKQKVGTFLSIGLEDKGFSYHPQEAFKAYQYLQSKNYKLPKYF